MNSAERSRESRMRRLANKFNLRLSKSRARNPDHFEYGLFALIDNETRGVVNDVLVGRYIHTWTLDDVEEYLTS